MLSSLSLYLLIVMFSHTYFSFRNCANHVLWPNTFRSFFNFTLLYNVRFDLFQSIYPYLFLKYLEGFLCQPQRKRVVRQLVSAGSQNRYMGTKIRTRLIIGCVFGILKCGLKVIILLSVCRLTIPAERFGAQVRYFLIYSTPGIVL
jgi:hypothetical protein